MIITIVKDISNDLNDLRIDNVTHETHRQLKRDIINVIQFHSDSKQLSREHNAQNEKDEDSFIIFFL